MCVCEQSQFSQHFYLTRLSGFCHRQTLACQNPLDFLAKTLLLPLCACARVCMCEVVCVLVFQHA